MSLPLPTVISNTPPSIKPSATPAPRPSPARVLSTGVQTERSPKLVVRRPTDDSPKQFNGLVYGDATTGKSSIAAMLADMGFKVFMVFTDLGRDAGISGAAAYAKKFSTKESFNQNVSWTAIDDLESFESFCEAPEKLIPDFWTAINPDFIILDGFSFLQQCQIMPEIEGMEDERSKDLTIEYGFDNFRGWGKIRNSTIRHLQDFLLITSPTGKPIHKILTAGLKVGSKQVGGTAEVVDLPEPDISGGAKKMIKYAFDLCWQTKKDKEGKYWYDFTGNYGKRRIETCDVLPANFAKIWELQQELWQG